MAKRDPEEDEEGEEGDDEGDEPVYSEEKYLILHVQKGLHGSQNYSLEFLPDEEFLRDTYGSGIFTLMQQQLNQETGKKGWRKVGKIVIEPPEGTIAPAPKGVPQKPVNSNLKDKVAQYRELADAKMEMAFADAISNKDYTAVETLSKAMGLREEKAPENDRYMKFLEKLAEQQLLTNRNPASSLKEQITTLKELKGLMDGQVEGPPENQWGSLAQHIPSVMDAMNKKTELDREVVRLKEKELEIKAKMIQTTPVAPQPPQKPPILDRFLMGIIGPTPNPGQLSQYVAMSPSKGMIEPSVKPAFDLEKMTDEDYDELCDLFEQPTFGAEAVIQRMRELGAQNPKYGEMAIILSTEKGKVFMSRILEIVEEILFPENEAAPVEQPREEKEKVENSPPKASGGKNDESDKPKSKK